MMRPIELVGLESVQLLAAFQVLSMPSRTFGGVTHKDARKVVRNLTGKTPKGRPEGLTCDLAGYLSWHFGKPMQVIECPVIGF